MDKSNIQILDLRGLKCPMPVLKATKFIKSLEAGVQIWLETTDPLAMIDIPAFCNENGHDLLEVEELESYNRFLVKKSAS